MNYTKVENKEKKKLSQNEWLVLILGTTFLFGSIARFFPGMQAGFPLNDGGMFYSMIRDLRSNGFVLPAITSYNHLNIPFAYPPFGFYFAAFLSSAFGFSEIEILRWLPPVVNTLSIFAFYALASNVLESRQRGAVAAIFYALTPGASAWFIMGGGLTRSFGSLFMLLSLWWVYRLFRTGGRTAWILSTVFCSLTVLSHPEVGIHTAAGCILLWLFYGRTWRSAIHALAVGLGTLSLSAPWWGSVLVQHGLAPFLSALNTGYHNQPFFLNIFWALTASQTAFPVLVVLRLVGILWGIWKRQYFLIAWFILPYLVDPRSAPSIAFYPFCMLIALAWADALPRLVDLLVKNINHQEIHERGWQNLSLLLLMVYLFIESGLYGFKLINTTLTSADCDALTWIRENTPPESYFLPVTGVQSPEIDPFVEWFPALTVRRGQTTIQGYEWLLGSEFYNRYGDFAEVQACKTADCIEEWSIRTGIEYQYLVVQMAGADKKLPASIDETGNYEVVYSANEILIYLLK